MVVDVVELALAPVMPVRVRVAVSEFSTNASSVIGMVMNCVPPIPAAKFTVEVKPPRSAPLVEM